MRINKNLAEAVLMLSCIVLVLVSAYLITCYTFFQIWIFQATSA